MFLGRPDVATVTPVSATETALYLVNRCSATPATTINRARSIVFVRYLPRLSSFFIRFKFLFLRWFASGEWIFSKYLCYLLA
jgi:hypothetical protein